MLLETNLPTNTNGKVPGSALDGTIYWFERNDEGDLVCEIPIDQHVSFFLGTGQFYPSDKVDFEDATNVLEEEAEQVEHEIHAKRGRPKKAD